MGRSILSLFFVALLCPNASAYGDEPDCAAWSDALPMSWPEDHPVWQFCWRRPAQSSPQPNGSGIELMDVRYNGHLIFERLNAPVLNVEYGPGGCGCFRDWLDFEARFEAIGLPCENGYCAAIRPPRTVCDCAPDNSCDIDPVNACNVDVGGFTGVAVEKQADRLILTSHTQAGWYRYTLQWHFFSDGSMAPEFGFSSVPNACTDDNHYHHAYLRMDFDIDGPANDRVILERRPDPGADDDGDGIEDVADNCLAHANPEQRDSDGDGYGNRCDADFNGDLQTNFVDLGSFKNVFLSTDPVADLNGDGTVNFVDLGLFKELFLSPPGPSGLIVSELEIEQETGAYAGGVQSWRIEDALSGRGIRILPGAEDHTLKVSNFDPAPFARGDWWVLAADPEELDDGGGGCAAQLDDLVDGEPVAGADLVFWYRIGDFHEGLDECQCGRVGPLLVPLGDWSAEAL